MKSNWPVGFSAISWPDVLFLHCFIYKQADKRLTADLWNFGIWICLQLVKQVVIRLRNFKNSCGQIVVFGAFLIRKQAPVSLNTERPLEDHGQKKHPFIPVGQIWTFSGWSACLVTVSHQVEKKNYLSKYRGFATSCKPLVSLKTRKPRLEFAKSICS